MLLDNKNHGKVITELKNHIDSSAKLSILSGLFSIYGFSALKKELSNIDSLRLLLSRWDDNSLAALAGTENEVRLKNALNQSRIAKDCASWLSKNIQVKVSHAPIG